MTASIDYQSTSLDDVPIDVKQIRAGLGIMGGRALKIGAVADYVSLEVDVPFGTIDASGYGVYGRALGFLTDTVSVSAQIGYLSLEDDADVSGLEFSVGVSLVTTESTRLFAEYRSANLSGDGEGELDLEDFRIGAGVRF